MKQTTRELCIQGLLTALVTVSTMVFQIPVSATQGYVHLGDSMILLIGVFFGARYGMLAGGVGSALADLLTGYAHWAPFTFVIKGLMGWLVGRMAAVKKGSRKEKFFTLRNLSAVLIGLIWMVFGYFVAGGILVGSFVTAAVSIPENIVQGAAGMIVFYVLGTALHKANIYRIIEKS